METHLKKSVSVVTPVHNECETIEEVVRSIHREVTGKLDNCEFIVAEDGSSDGTKGILKKLQCQIPFRLVTSAERKGYARSVRDALGLARKEIVFFLDSDGQHKVSDFWKMLPFIDDFDVVSGYKCPRSDPPLRLFISRVMNALIFFMFGCFFRDINSGFKMFRKGALDKLLAAYAGLDFISTEFLIKAYLMKMKIAEVPVLHFKRKFGESRGLPVRKLPLAILKLFCDLLRMRLRFLFLRQPL